MQGSIEQEISGVFALTTESIGETTRIIKLLHREMVKGRQEIKQLLDDKVDLLKRLEKYEPKKVSKSNNKTPKQS